MSPPNESGPRAPEFRRVPRDSAPLSFVQRRLWFLQCLDPESIDYIEQSALSLRGVLDVGALERSLQETIRRHEILRTTFDEENGQPVQRIHPAAPLRLRVDVPETAGTSGDALVNEIAEAEMSRPFRLSREQPFRVRLVRAAQDHHVLIQTWHHIATDGWSGAVFRRELLTLYEAFAAGRPSPLAETSVQYSDYAVYERALLSEEALEADLAFWRTHLEDIPLVLDLPTDRPRPPVRVSRGAILTRTLDPATWRGLAGLCRRRRATEFIGLLTAFGVLIGRHGDRDAMVIGTPAANRAHAETYDMLGCFVNTLALGLKVDESRSFAELLDATRDRTIAAYDHQSFPFEKLVQGLRVHRDLARTPVVQVMLNFRRDPPPRAPPEGLVVRPFVFEGAIAKFDLSLDVIARRDPEAYEMKWEYATDLFNRSTIDRIADRFEALLARLVQVPNVPVASVSMLSAAEDGELITNRNETAAQTPRACLHDLFAEQAQRTPDAVAIEHEGRTLRYRDLTDAARKAGGALRRAGVTHLDRVALCCARSPDLVAAMLGTLGVGAAYVPIDPAFPTARRQQMLSDCAPRVLVTDNGPPGEAPCVLRLAELFERESEVDLPSSATPNDPAYIIYTSGSTGTPKGVVVEHASIANYLAAFQRSVELGPSDRVLQFATPSFDASVEEIFGALLCGAALILRSEAMGGSYQAFLEACEGARISVLDLPTAFWQGVVAALGEGAPLPSSIRAVIIGGERADQRTVARWWRAVPRDIELWNTYGPTEATVVATMAKLRRGDTGEIPIGAPISNVFAHVLSRWGRPVPVGVTGELYLGGACLARGYLNRPEQTLERFVPNPFGPGRLYRTGDKVRRRADGALEYVGRADDQVKVRGFRVELGEVESAITAVDGVREAVVVARGEGDRRHLVAYAVFAGSARPPDDLRASLRGKLTERLPAHAVPSAIVVLPALPQTPSGKVDRAALPDPDRGADASSYAPPRTETEAHLARVWEELLGVERVGVNDDFFELGGHSLLATQIASRIRSELHLEIVLTAIFQAPTVARLAERLERAAPRQTLLPQTVVPRLGYDRPVRASLAQESYLRQYARAAARAPSLFTIACAWRITGELDVGALAGAVDDLVHRDEALRTTFEPLGSVIFQRVTPPTTGVLVVEPSAGLDPADLSRRLHRAAQAPVDLARGPLFRAHLFHNPSSTSTLLLTAHHTIVDGWSFDRVIPSELEALYAARRDGNAIALEPPALQQRDFAAWEREYLSGPRLESLLEHWRSELAGAPTTLDLPTDRPRPALQQHEGGVFRFDVPADLTRALRELARDSGATLFMLLLSAFGVVIGREVNRDDLLIATPVAKRSRPELARTVGLFADDLPIRVRLPQGAPFDEILAGVRQSCIAAFNHEAVPWDALLEALGVQDDPSRAPLCQISLALASYEPAALHLADLTLEPIDVGIPASQNDLALYLTDVGDGLAATFHYDAALFDPATMERLARALRELLERVAP